MPLLIRTYQYTPNYWYVRINSGTGKIFARFHGTDNSGGEDYLGTSDITDGIFHHVVIVSQRGSAGVLYVDGSDETAASPTLPVGDDLSASSDLKLNGWEIDGVGKELLAYVDEFRIHHYGRSSAWVGASYETQRDHFITYGAIQETITVPHGLPTRRRRKPKPHPPTPYENILRNAEAFTLFKQFIELKRGRHDAAIPN